MSYLRRKFAVPVLVGEIDLSTDRYILSLRIIKLWKTWKNKKVVSIDMVCHDREGTRIHATIDEELVVKFQTRMIEGRVYTISNFTFGSYTSDYRTTPLEFKIVFYRTTVVQPCSDFPTEVSNKYLKDFAEIFDGKFANDVLIDVIGQVVNITPLQVLQARGKDTQKIDIILHVSKRDSSSDPSVVVCVVRFACVREWKGVYSISNSFSATQVVFNPQTEQANTFRSSLPDDNIKVTRNLSSRLSNAPLVDVRAEFLVNNRRMTICDIVQNGSVGVFVTLAKVVAVDRISRWYYVACNACNKKVHP
ncbi:unnamed protein product [Arabis nemorensis]|uniref:Replication protein A 70 kDa DNA-binding subunit B/D first OB fold domain-containing protein n=1 Tax=Arabis nemorensis TaxID=586526 RepID=A0A565BA43_9BRAS|nr:unnamed protein product [Arabis nemorensis]